MSRLKVHYQQALSFIQQEEIELFQKEIDLYRKQLYDGTGAGSDFLGWIDLPEKTESELLQQIEADASAIRQQSDVVVVVGIGGSYLGARAVIDALSEPLQHSSAPEVLYAGHHLDEAYHHALLDYLNDKQYSVIVISKSGTTTEPAVAFRLLRKQLEEKHGQKEAAGRIYAITDARRGALKQLATEQGYASYVIPDDVGGRYSVLTPVGLLPIAAAGLDIRNLLAGAREMASHLKEEQGVPGNTAALYAVLRNLMYKKGRTIEVLASYTPSLFYVTEWWKQLFGESEGKEGKGIFPAGVSFTTDLHSMGQYIQDGMKNFFETVITVSTNARKLTIPDDKENLDGLNYLSGKRLGFVNEMATKGTMLAHVDGNVPNLEIELPELNARYLGQLIYFFEMACAISGYMLGVNPFDQPGVEAYKRNMFALLGKPGFEDEALKLTKRLNK